MLIGPGVVENQIIVRLVENEDGKTARIEAWSPEKRSWVHGPCWITVDDLYFELRSVYSEEH